MNERSCQVLIIARGHHCASKCIAWSLSSHRAPHRAQVVLIVCLPLSIDAVWLLPPALPPTEQRLNQSIDGVTVQRPVVEPIVAIDLSMSLML